MSDSLWLHGVHAARQASLSFTINLSLLRFMFTESMMLSNHLILWCPLLLLPSILPSMRVFSKESASIHINCPEYWRFIINPSNKYCGLISFRIDWFDLLAVQGTLKSLLQHHNLKASILGCSAFFESLVCAEILHSLTIHLNYKPMIGIIITPSLHMRKLKWKSIK